jgi:hypothetical protein
MPAFCATDILVLARANHAVASKDSSVEVKSELAGFNDNSLSSRFLQGSVHSLYYGLATVRVT